MSKYSGFIGTLLMRCLFFAVHTDGLVSSIKSQPPDDDGNAYLALRGRADGALIGTLGGEGHECRLKDEEWE